jgi:tripartite-type tricarboxylate transporter receptor subunit TctC
MSKRRSFLRGAAAIAAAATIPVRASDTFPSRPITLLVGFAAGGVGDIVARTVAKEASRLLGKPVIIENRPAPGAAPAAAAKAPPDGYTLLLAGNGTAITHALFRTLPYDLIRDFRHVTTLAFFDLVLLADASSQFRSVADFVTHAMRNPGQLNIATVRIGSTQNLGAELFKSAAGIDALIVPYRSTADVIGALRSGDAGTAVEFVPPILGLLLSGSVRPLAVMSSKRFDGLPQVPTMIESGYPGFEAASWNGISVPAATPQAIVDKLGKAFRQAAGSAQAQSELKHLGVVTRASTAEEMTNRLMADIAKWQAVIEKARIPRH